MSHTFLHWQLLVLLPHINHLADVDNLLVTVSNYDIGFGKELRNLSFNFNHLVLKQCLQTFCGSVYIFDTFLVLLAHIAQLGFETALHKFLLLVDHVSQIKLQTLNVSVELFVLKIEVFI